MKWSVTLTDRLGPEMLAVLEIKGQVLHRVRLHVKVPGLLLNLNALLTTKPSPKLGSLVTSILSADVSSTKSFLKVSVQISTRPFFPMSPIST